MNNLGGFPLGGDCVCGLFWRKSSFLGEKENQTGVMPSDVDLCYFRISTMKCSKGRCCF